MVEDISIIWDCLEEFEVENDKKKFGIFVKLW